MGLIRLLLACAVLWGHSAGVTPTPILAFLNPYHAVQAFFIISGFYMALISKKYSGMWMTFYINRYSRLIVSFWIVAFVSFFFWSHNPQFNQGITTDPPLLAIVSNFLLWGADLTQFFHHNGSEMTFWLMVPQSWSLGAELWFYLLVPFLVPLRTQTIMLIIAASIAIRIGINMTDLPFHPWQQRFFPAELPFFLSGMLSHRFYVWANKKKYIFNIHGVIALCVGVALITLIGHIPGAHVMETWKSFLVAATLFLLLPPIFFITNKSKVDRWLGEFSYPIYLWHIIVIFFLGAKASPFFGEKVLALSFLLSVPLVLFVERPLDRWRQNRISRGKQQILPGFFE